MGFALSSATHSQWGQDFVRPLSAHRINSLSTQDSGRAATQPQTAGRTERAEKNAEAVRGFTETKGASLRSTGDSYLCSD